MDTLSVSLVRMTCSECGVIYGMESVQQARRQDDGGAFYCTNGHKQVYIETALRRTQRELEAEKRRSQFAREDAERWRARHASAKHQVRAHKGAATKLRKRVANGVCPCCTRSFVNLRRHIETKHPDFPQVAE